MKRIGILSLILLLVTGLAAACGGGDDKAEIESVVKDALQAVSDGDMDKYMSFFTKECQGKVDKDALKAALDSLDEAFPGAKMKLEKVEVKKIEGDKATVSITNGFVDKDGNPLEEAGGITTEESEAVKEDGKWRNPDCTDLPQKS